MSSIRTIVASEITRHSASGGVGFCGGKFAIQTTKSAKSRSTTTDNIIEADPSSPDMDFYDEHYQFDSHTQQDTDPFIARCSQTIAWA